MQVSSKQLTANLIALRVAIDEMLLQINGVEPVATESGECTHRNKVRAMGGNWFCPDCKTEGREELAE